MPGSIGRDAAVRSVLGRSGVRANGGGAAAPPAGFAAFFEDPAHFEQVLGHLDDGRLPLKYAYAGSGALAHAALASTSGYQTVVGAAEHEADALFAALPAGPPSQIVEIGPGTGGHTAAFLAELQRGARPRPTRPLRYLGFDFSGTLLGIAADRISRAPLPRMQTALWDVEADRTARIDAWRDADEPLLICVLGHTLGNFEDPERALRNLARSARSGDLLLAGVTLCPPDFTADDARALLEPYDNHIFASAVLEPWRAARLGGGAVDFSVALAGRTVVGTARFTRTVMIAGHCYPRDTAVRCFSSARFLVPEALDLLARSGWRPVGWRADPAGTHLAAVAIL